MNKKTTWRVGTIAAAVGIIIAACGGGGDNGAGTGGAIATNQMKQTANVSASTSVSLNASDTGKTDSKTAVQVVQGTVIRNVTIVNTRDGSLSAPMAIVIDQGKIQKITLAQNVHTGGTAQDVDGTGKYIVPGFLDMHTHLFNLSESSAELPQLEKLFVANGITGIREMGGSADWVQRAKRFNADLAMGKFDAPEILLISGRIIGFPAYAPSPDVGAPPAASTSAAAAVQEVQAQKGYGAGFIKTVAANHDATLAMLAEAKKQGLGVAGHLNISVSAKDSSNAGWRAIEHLGGASMAALLDCSTEEDTIRASLIKGNGIVPPADPPTAPADSTTAPVFQRVYDTYDSGKCQQLANTFAKNETWQVPTLIRNRTIRFIDDQAYRSDPNLMYVSKISRAQWESSAQKAAVTFPASAIATYHQFFNLEMAFTKLMKQSGVKMLTGSDTSIHPVLSATWIIPGVSLHQEFALLAKAGLAPLEILQMTTLNGAQFLNREATMGTVDEGKNADLVLLDANPILSVANLDKISGVFLKGKYFSAAMLANMKAEVAKSYKDQPLNAIDLGISLNAPAHVD